MYCCGQSPVKHICYISKLFHLGLTLTCCRHCAFLEFTPFLGSCMCYECLKSLEAPGPWHGTILCVYNILSGIMAGSVCPEEIMRQVVDKMYMKQVTVRRRQITVLLKSNSHQSVMTHLGREATLKTKS